MGQPVALLSFSEEGGFTVPPPFLSSSTPCFIPRHSLLLLELVRFLLSSDVYVSPLLSHFLIFLV